MFHARIWEVYGLFRWGLQSLVSLTKGLKVFLRLRLHSIVTGLELSIRSNATKTPGRFICNPSSHVLVSFVPDCAICVTSSSTIGKNRFSSGKVMLSQSCLLLCSYLHHGTGNGKKYVVLIKGNYQSS